MDIAPIIIALVVITILVWLITKPRRAKQKTADRTATLISSTRQFVDQINHNRRFSVITTQINLQKNEFAVLSTQSTCHEYKSERISTGAGTRIKVGGMPVYLGGTKSRSVDKLREASTGTLYLTNKRLIFIGTPKNHTFTLGEILSIENGIDHIIVTSQKRQKPLVFSVSNGFNWHIYFGALAQWNLESPETPGEIQLN